MKKLFLTLLISLTFIGSNFAQIPKEAFDLTNSLPRLWHNEEIDKAVESSLELYRIYPPMFIERIHNTFAQNIVYGSKQCCLKYLEQLYSKNNQDINEIITPIFLWCKTINSKDKSALESTTEELWSLLKDSSNYNSRKERYCLLIIKELDKRNSIDKKTKEELIKRNIKNLEKYSFLVDVPSNKKESERRAWQRYLIAYSYDYLYSNISNKEEYLKKASDYSPDLNDRLNKYAYFYDAAILTGNPREIGFKSKYQKYLVDNNRKKSEALNLLCEITFKEPSDNNIKSLKEFYENSKNDESFNTFWEGYIHKQGKIVPHVKIQFKNEVLDLTHKTKNWIYIDVWGTWCNPCRKELPELQSLYSANQQMKNSKLKIYTFSFSSQNLSDFMVKNKYTFPVSEIDKATNDLFEVSGYPTKILISPEGNYIKIPFGVDWKTFIKNYTLM